MNLNQYGWNDWFERRFREIDGQPPCQPARVVSARRQIYGVVGEQGEAQAQVSGRFRHRAADTADFPTAGDWVGIRHAGGREAAVIHFTVPRRTWLSRKAPGQRVEEQLVCANVDRVFLVSALDRDFNLRRIERYLSSIFEGGAEPVIVLNKVDLCPEAEARVLQVRTVCFDLPLIRTSALSGEGLEALGAWLEPGKTAAFVGSSGVGKSTLINRLLGEQAQETRELRADGKGRHTTTHRELFLIPAKGMVIDNPGMRELQLWAHLERLGDTFAEIEQLAGQCRFSDCLHQGEPGCAVRREVEAGKLDPKRLASYLRQERELERLSRTDGLERAARNKLRRQEGRQWEKSIRSRFKDKY
jgi:ribosome biogenesis GTPase